MNHSLIVPIVIAVGAVLTILFDGAMRGEHRPNFAMGICLSAVALIALVCLNGNMNLHSSLGILIVGSLLILALLGGLIVDQTNIDDQESGRMSRWGSWWDGFGDNYFQNVTDKWENIVLIAVIFIGMLYLVVKNEYAAKSQPEIAFSSTRTTSGASRTRSSHTTISAGKKKAHAHSAHGKHKP